MPERFVLVFNPGSSSIKLGLFRLEDGGAHRVGKGGVDLSQSPLVLRFSKDGEDSEAPLGDGSGEDLHAVLDKVLGWLSQHFALDDLAGAGHRVVHGGERFTTATLIDDAALEGIKDLIPLAPLHQPQSVRLIEAVRRLRPGLPQVACFDTAFHASQTDLVRRFALPRELHDRGIKRYGFHGLSYQFIASGLRRRFPDLADRRVVVAHLGSGASLCALAGGVSRDTSMSFSTLDGIPMATRCGALDPGVLLHLLGQEGLIQSDLEDMLYHRSGLLGVSGISGDTRVLLENGSSEASEALDLFALRIAGEVSRLAATLGGFDGLVFTAGIGEHQPAIRAAIARRLSWLGLDIDAAANERGDGTISTAGSRVRALVIPTDEEQVIADETMALL